MQKDIIKVIMNPVRMRIAQYLMMHEKGTAGEIKEELSDIPPASLYRHIKVLFDAGMIEVLEEKKIRGTIEKTYGLVKNPQGLSEGDLGRGNVSNDEINRMIQQGLMIIMGEFQKYFAGANPQPEKDMLVISTSTLMMSDEELMEVLQSYGNSVQKNIANKPEKGRRERRLTIVVSPSQQ